ncbi:hypothetical protein ACJX0J_009141, partial [Zea mays]
VDIGDGYLINYDMLIVFHGINWLHANIDAPKYMNIFLFDWVVMIFGLNNLDANYQCAMNFSWALLFIINLGLHKKGLLTAKCDLLGVEQQETFEKFLLDYKLLLKKRSSTEYVIAYMTQIFLIIKCIDYLTSLGESNQRKSTFQIMACTCIAFSTNKIANELDIIAISTSMFFGLHIIHIKMRGYIITVLALTGMLGYKEDIFTFYPIHLQLIWMDI